MAVSYPTLLIVQRENIAFNNFPPQLQKFLFTLPDRHAFAYRYVS